MTKAPQDRDGTRVADSARNARLGAALRANLRRRKAQSRARDAPGDAGDIGPDSVDARGPDPDRDGPGDDPDSGRDRDDGDAPHSETLGPATRGRGLDGPGQDR